MVVNDVIASHLAHSENAIGVVINMNSVFSGNSNNVVQFVMRGDGGGKFHIGVDFIAVT
ncbi:hypothetical protein D3C81_2232080 [compost metagenome]